jgi:hypothetical protein
VTGKEAARRLRERAATYSRDAGILRHSGEDSAVDAILYEAIRDELRACADWIEKDEAPHHEDSGMALDRLNHAWDRGEDA